MNLFFSRLDSNHFVEITAFGMYGRHFILLQNSSKFYNTVNGYMNLAVVLHLFQYFDDCFVFVSYFSCHLLINKF